MKRKFKLMSSIASVSLAVALLVTGAFAVAKTRQVELTGSVSFSAIRVNAEVEVHEFYNNATPTIVGSKLEFSSAITGGDQEGKDVTLGFVDKDIKLDDETNKSYTYTVKVTSKQDADLYFKFDESHTVGATGGYSLAVTSSLKDAGNDVFDGEKAVLTTGAKEVTFTVTLTILDPSKMTATWTYGNLVGLLELQNTSITAFTA